MICVIAEWSVRQVGVLNVTGECGRRGLCDRWVY